MPPTDRTALPWAAIAIAVVSAVAIGAPCVASDGEDEVGLDLDPRDVEAEAFDSDTGAISALRVGDDVVARIRAPYGGMSAIGRGELVARRLRSTVGVDGALDSLRPERLNEDLAAVVTDDRVIITADLATAEQNQTSPFGLARAWTKNLREAFGLSSLEDTEWSDALEDPNRPSGRDTEVMVASWYSDRFTGRRTASGEPYDPAQLTAAHRTLPFGTVLEVTYPPTEESVEVRVNDRGPFVSGRDLDLSRAAATQLGMAGAGVAEVEVSVLEE